MRKDTTVVLNSSLTNKYNIEENTELETAQKIQRMEIIPDDKECEMVAVPTMLSKTNTPTHEDQASMNKPRKPNKPQCYSYRYDLRKFGKTNSAKGKILSLKRSKTNEGDEGNTSATKKRKLEKEKTTASCDALHYQSKVEHWLSRNESRPPSGREEVNSELLSSNLEKLDTTLNENRQNVQSLLEETLAQFRSRLEAKANEHEVLIQQTIMNLEQTIEEEIKKLLKEFQTQICDIIRDGARKDHDAVAPLKEECLRRLPLTLRKIRHKHSA